MDIGVVAGSYLATDHRVLAHPADRQFTLDLVDIFLVGKRRDTQVVVVDGASVESLNGDDLVACPVLFQTQLTHFLIVSCFAHSDKAGLVELDPLFLQGFDLFRHLRHPQMIQFLLDGNGPVTWQSECLNELIGFGLDDSLDSPLLLQPSLHENQLPGLLNTQSPSWHLLIAHYWNYVIDVLHMILSISAHEILVKPLSIHFLSEKTGLDVLTVDHAELRQEGRQVVVLARKLQMRFLEVLLSENVELLIVKLIDPPQAVLICVLHLQLKGKTFVSEESLFRLGNDPAESLPATTAQRVEAAGRDLVDGIALLPWADFVDVINLLLHDLNGQQLQPTMLASHTKPIQKKITPKGTDEILLAGEVPEHVRQLLIDNKRMQKRIQVLQAELEEKGRVIAGLKDHLDEGVIESTQQKLAYYRTMEEAVEKQVQEARQQMAEQQLQLKDQYLHTTAQLQAMRERLNEEIGKNSFLMQKIESLKQYIIDIIDEKDYLIAELGAIISQQEKKGCERRNRRDQQRSPGGGQQRTGKKPAFIKRNQ